MNLLDLRYFIKQNRQNWDELESILITISKSNSKTQLEIFDRFNLLYQKTANNLSYCQTYFPDEEITPYLNELVSKAHNILYKDQITSFNQIKHFLSDTFVRLLIDQKNFIFFAFILFFVGALAGFLSVMNNPLNLYSLLPAEIAHNVDPEQLGQNNENIDSAQMSAYIMTNNIRVAFLAFIGGLTLGVFTFYLLVQNGLMLGALAALFLQHEKFYDFWAYIIPHGIIELTAIFIAGGSGLLMGYRIISPGPYPRSFQVKKQSLHSAQLLLGTIPLFIIAGIIEGYITPASISLEAKYAFSIFTLFALIFYITFFGIRLKKKDKSTIVPD